MFFGQKLKSNFLKEAEKGSRFFHSLMSQKHRRNHIPAIQVPSGGMTSSGDEVGREIVRFYKVLIGSAKYIVPINDYVILYGPCLNSSSHDSLLGPVTNELIQQTLFSICNDKSLGPHLSVLKKNLGYCWS